MAETLDELGPVDWIVVEFPGPDFGKGQIAPFLEDLVNRDLVRVLDMVFLRKTEDGTLETAEISDIGVWTIPGATTYARIPSPAWFRAMVWATFRTAAFEAA